VVKNLKKSLYLAFYALRNVILSRFLTKFVKLTKIEFSAAFDIYYIESQSGTKKLFNERIGVAEISFKEGNLNEKINYIIHSTFGGMYKSNH
jgi:hypothetical protein